MFSPRTRLLPLLFLTALLLVNSLACTVETATGPKEGYWMGDHLIFQVKDGHVFEIGATNISCNGDDGACFAEGNRFFPVVSLVVTDFKFSGTLVDSMVGTVQVSGRFETSTYATGEYAFTAANGCCTATGDWRAEFAQPYESEIPDVGGDGEEPDITVESDLPPVDSAYPSSATEEQIQAILHVNEIRGFLDIPFLEETEPINMAAQAHAEYFEAHCAQYQDGGLSPHSENPQWPEGFSGQSFYDRMNHFGFSGIPGWEVMAFVGNPIGAVDGWMETLYHRIPFVHPNTFETGYGTMVGGCYRWSGGTDVMNFSKMSSTPVTDGVAYPYDGQTGVNNQWDGYESPQPPMPPGAGYPSGPIITMTFPEGGKFSISEHFLFAPDDTAVPHMWVDPGNDPAGFLQQTVSLYALNPLDTLATYRVRLAGKWKGEERIWEWSFTTGEASSQW